MRYPLRIRSELGKQRRRVAYRAELCEQDRIALRESVSRAKSGIAGALGSPGGLLVCLAAGFVFDRTRGGGPKTAGRARSLLNAALLGARFLPMLQAYAGSGASHLSGTESPRV